MSEPLDITKWATDTQKEVEEAVAELQQAFLEIQQPRTDFEIEHYVVGQHDTPAKQYAQCVLEMQIIYDNIRRANLNKKRVNLELQKLKKIMGEQTDQIEKQITQIDIDNKNIDMEVQDRAMLGALREFKALYAVYKAFPKKYTREELNNDQPEYWKRRLSRQANQDIASRTCGIGVGNLDAIKQFEYSPVKAQQIALQNNGVVPPPPPLPSCAMVASAPQAPTPAAPAPALISHPATLPPNEAEIQDVERRYLASNPSQKIIFVIPTVKKLESILPSWIPSIRTPTGWQIKYFNVFGRTVAGAYNEGARQAIEDEAELMFTIEDDTVCPPDALFRLMEHYRQGKVAIGGWYPKRQEVREGTPIIVVNGKRTHLMADGETHEVFTLPMGCSLYAVKIFKEIKYPWFATTDCLTQDSFFSQKARDAGYKLYVDTSIRCKHVDRVTGKVYE